MDNIRLNTVIKNDNLDQLMPLVERAAAVGCGVTFSLYTDNKNGNRRHLVREEQIRALDDAIASLLDYKRARRGVITNSDYYLRAIPRFLRGEMNEPCESGISTIHVDPGRLREALPRFSHRLSLARLPPLSNDQLQRVLLRVSWRGAGAADGIAHPGRDGMNASRTRSSL